MADQNKNGVAPPAPAKPEWTTRMCPFLTMARASTLTRGENDTSVATCLGPACALFLCDAQNPAEGNCAIALNAVFTAHVAAATGGAPKQPEKPITIHKS